MKFILLMTTFVIGSALIYWAAKGNGSIAVWDSWPMDLMCLALGLNLVVTRGISIFHKIFG